MTRKVLFSAVAGTIAVTLSGDLLLAQRERPASPEGTAATEVRGKYVGGGDEPVYRDGKWIEITYGRPIRRGRDLWGSGADYGRKLYGGAPVWRASFVVSAAQPVTALPLR